MTIHMYFSDTNHPPHSLDEMITNNLWLQAFIHTRSWGSSKAPPGTKWGDKNALVARAHALRAGPVLVEEEAPAPPPPPPPVVAPVVVVALPGPGTDAAHVPVARKAASEYIRNDIWRSHVEAYIKGNKQPCMLSMDDQASLAGDVARQLDQRLTRHIQTKVEQPNRGNFSLRFTSEMIPLVAAMTVMMNHVKKDMSCVSLVDSMLKASTNFFCEVNGSNSTTEGCYLYFDMENGVWIRSGKTCGQGTDSGKRHEQHHKAALDPRSTHSISGIRHVLAWGRSTLLNSRSATLKT